MPVTMEQVRNELDRDEPDYNQAAQLGPEAIPHLEQLVQEGDPMLASKATYLASLIQSNKSVSVVELAARSSRDVVRVAAAAGFRNLAHPPADLADQLLHDPDVGVRKTALLSIEINPTVGVRNLLTEISRNDPEAVIQQLARRIADQLL